MGTRRRSGVVALAVTIIALLASGVVVWAATSARSPAAGPSVVSEKTPGETAAADVDTDGLGSVGGTEPAAMRVHRQWQRRREQAWAAGDTAALRRLYVDPSAARADVRQLRGWLTRGATGVGLTHQVLGYEVQAAAETRVRLRLTHRVARAVVHSDGPDLTLPRGGAVTQVVVLRRIGEEWRVARVRSVG